MQHPDHINPWQAWSLEVQRTLQLQQQQIENLANRVEELCAQIKQLEARPSYTIESIQYHFDQLKVEKLDGTLNIGMTTPGEDGSLFSGSGHNGTVEQLAVPKPEVFPAASNVITPPSPMYEAIYAQMNQYMDCTAPIKLQELEEQYGIPLDPYHRQLIIEDIRKQMPGRIKYYITKHYQESGSPNANAGSTLNESLIAAKAMKDADAAMHAYFNQLKSKGENPS